jgi:hypothetical protein
VDVAPSALTVSPDVAAPPGATAAERAARRNFEANLRALGASQRDFAEGISTVAASVTPMFGRDGSLTALNEAGRWWSGCSLPLRAARAVLRTLDVRGPVGCFLAPPHAAHLRVTLETLRPWQAVIAIVPEEREARVMLQCDDFSADISRGRLWFASGDAWAARLEQLFRDQPGLPTPSQFIRLPGADAQKIDPLIAAAQKVFPNVLARRAEEIGALRDARQTTPDNASRLCVVAPMRFDLWDDAPFALYTALRDTAPAGVILAPVRADEPASASPLAVARAAAACGAIVTADTSRADAPDLLPADMPWVTWVTKAKVPAFKSAAPNDALLVADPAWVGLARSAGWPAARIEIASWPPLAAGRSEEPAASPFAALIADTVPLDAPERLNDFSSHLLLWNTLREELTHDPFALGPSPEAFLDARMRRYGVSSEGFDRPLVLDALIAPAFTQGVARTLLAAGVPLQLFGTGWPEIPELSAHAFGLVADRVSLRRIVHNAAALVYAWPSPHAHPLDACGRPVVRYRGGGANALVAAARAALKATTPMAAPGETLSAEKVFRLINRSRGG